MSQTPEGQAELEQRRKAAYARHGAARDANSYTEAWRWAQKAGAPYEALRTLREGPADSAALAAARKFNRDTEALFLLLLGPPGVGKTLAASLVAVDFASKWPWNEQPSGSPAEPIRYTDAAPLTRLSAFDAEAKRYVEALRSCQLLVLEDAGDEGTELGKGLFVELLMARHASRRRSVITGNLRPESFRARYGAAVADRIRTAGYVPDLFGEKSRRARRPQEMSEART
jgi:DNA replication protein DnaC